jgi:hypothetical protein
MLADTSMYNILVSVVISIVEKLMRFFRGGNRKACRKFRL